LIGATKIVETKVVATKIVAMQKVETNIVGGRLYPVSGMDYINEPLND
jgi:hypothetical protein